MAACLNNCRVPWHMITSVTERDHQLQHAVTRYRRLISMFIPIAQRCCSSQQVACGATHPAAHRTTPAAQQELGKLG
eukprot:1160989-Pelagomonas_calceolata.AAC.3